MMSMYLTISALKHITVVTGSTKLSPGDRERPQFKQRELPQSKVAVVHTKLACWVREEFACPEITHCPEPSLISTIDSPGENGRGPHS